MNEHRLWTKGEIQDLLEKNDRAVIKAVLTIYKRQTSDEQVALVTTHANSVGFNGLDAEILSSFAQQLQKQKARNDPKGYWLSPKQMAIARNKIKKYWKQLLEEANRGGEVGKVD